MRPPLAKVTGHLAPKSFGPSLLERGILYLKGACFGLRCIEQAILQFDAGLFCFMAYRTRDITFEAR